MFRPGRSAATFAALMLASAFVAPAVGAFDVLEETGTTGFTEVNDYNGLPGVKCQYENNPGKKNDEIDKIKIIPQFAHGPFANKTWVGSRFVILKDKKPFNGKYRRIFASKIIKAKGSDSIPAAFDTRKWKAPEGAKARYRVRQIFFYYKPGSKKLVGGKLKGEFEVYSHRLLGSIGIITGQEGGDNGQCHHKFWAPLP